MTTFYIARHGETENNKRQRFSGWIDTPLTEAGMRDAMSAAAKLKGMHFDRIISSDLGRAFTTAYIISRQLGYAEEIERTKELREVNYGDFANQPHEVYPSLSPHENTTFASPNGESLAAMQRRVMPYIWQLSADNPNRTVLLVAHDGTINAVRSSFTQEEIGLADRTHHAHDFIGKFSVTDGRIASFEEVQG